MIYGTSKYKLYKILSRELELLNSNLQPIYNVRLTFGTSMYKRLHCATSRPCSPLLYTLRSPMMIAYSSMIMRRSKLLRIGWRSIQCGHYLRPTWAQSIIYGIWSFTCKYQRIVDSWPHVTPRLLSWYSDHLWNRSHVGLLHFAKLEEE